MTFIILTSWELVDVWRKFLWDEYQIDSHLGIGAGGGRPAILLHKDDQ